MINVKKGTGHSLSQSDWRGKGTVDPITRVFTPVVVAGQVVSRTGGVDAIVLGVGTIGDQIGFAVTNSVEGDAIESGKIGAYALDGNSVIETDQVLETINTTNFPYGAPVYAVVGGSNAGLVSKLASSNVLVGRVDGIRTIFVGQTPHTLLGIKLTA